MLQFQCGMCFVDLTVNKYTKEIQGVDFLQTVFGPKAPQQLRHGARIEASGGLSQEPQALQSGRSGFPRSGVGREHGAKGHGHEAEPSGGSHFEPKWLGCCELLFFFNLYCFSVLFRFRNLLQLRS